jgi:hypothetical protein
LGEESVEEFGAVLDALEAGLHDVGELRYVSIPPVTT